MKLSDAIQAGAGMLQTPGPSHVLDCWTAAQAGLLGRWPSPAETCPFYWENPWGIAPGSDLEYWLRLTVTAKYHWSDIIKRLRRFGV